MNSKKGRKKDGKERQDAHVRACKAERRRQKNRECRDCKEYERKRKEESRVKKVRIKQLASLVCDTLPNASKTDTARIVCLVDMTYRNNSYRRHVAYMDEHSGSVSMYGLKKVPSKSGLHDWQAISGTARISCRSFWQDRPETTRAARCRETRLGSP